MEILTVHFGAEPPQTDYRKQADGHAEVWLYRNIKQDEDGGWCAEGVFFTSRLSLEEIEAQRDSYFAPDPPSPEEAALNEIYDALVELGDLLAAQDDALVEIAELIGEEE